MSEINLDEEKETLAHGYIQIDDIKHDFRKSGFVAILCGYDRIQKRCVVLHKQLFDVLQDTNVMGRMKIFLRFAMF